MGSEDQPLAGESVFSPCMALTADLPVAGSQGSSVLTSARGLKGGPRLEISSRALWDFGKRKHVHGGGRQYHFNKQYRHRLENPKEHGTTQTYKTLFDCLNK